MFVYWEAPGFLTNEHLPCTFLMCGCSVDTIASIDWTTAPAQPQKRGRESHPAARKGGGATPRGSQVIPCVPSNFFSCSSYRASTTHSALHHSTPALQRFAGPGWRTSHSRGRHSIMRSLIDPLLNCTKLKPCFLQPLILAPPATQN